MEPLQRNQFIQTERDLFTLYGREKIPAIFLYSSVVLFFLSISLTLFFIPLWDYDFWWHIATGRYIYVERAIPLEDPFSFTSELRENKNLYPERERVILTQYWLAQLIFYGIYKNLGGGGIVFLRNLLLIGSLGLLFLFYKKKGIPLSIALIFATPVFLSLLKFTGERPVLFTIFFSILTFVAIDLYISKRSGLFYFLPLIMLLWANLHGGWVLGNAILILALIGEGIRYLFKKSNITERDILAFYGISILSLIVSGINPNGFTTYLVTFSPEYYPFTKGIQEYTPLIQNIREIKLMRPDYGHMVLALLFILLLILRNIHFNITYFLILSFLLLASIKAMRFTVYFSLIGGGVLAKEFYEFLKYAGSKITFPEKYIVIGERLLIAGTLISLFIFSSGRINLKNKFWIADVPLAEAVDFVEKNNLKGNMLNSYAGGGYLAWRFYPDRKTFIDSRGLNLTVMAEYGWIFDAKESIYQERLPEGRVPLWKRLLNHYNINCIVLELETMGTVPPIILRLLDEREWVPVFLNLRSIVFVRRIPEHSKVIELYKKTPEEVINYLIIRGTLGALQDDFNPRYLVSLGEIFVKFNRIDDAITAYKYALKRAPHNENIKQRIEELEKKKEEVKNEKKRNNTH